METRPRIGTAAGLTIALLLFGNVAPVRAIGGNDASTATQVNKNTEKCQKEIAAKGQKYWEARVKELDKCLDAAQKCDEQKNASKATDCRKKLIEEAKGKCAVGKLDSGTTTIGNDATLGKTKSDKPKLDKELAKWRDAVQKKCFDTDEVNVTSATRGLGFSGGPFANADELMNVLNASPGGVGCLTHEQVQQNTPTADGPTADESIILTLRNLETAGFSLAEALNEIQDDTNCQ